MYKLYKNIRGEVDAIIRLLDNAGIPLNPNNTDYANFKKEILADEAQLQDAEGVIMTDAKAYVKELP